MTEPTAKKAKSQVFPKDFGSGRRGAARYRRWVVLDRWYQSGFEEPRQESDCHRH